ncbi:MAG: (5-formylfuran-3-yl)methyl phosphate synthase, partial [Aureliella sp.]
SRRVRGEKVASKASALIANAPSASRQSPGTLPPRPQLLVSVQNACEARVAQRQGVPRIDLKNPTLGSLGCPDQTTAREVLDALAEGQSGASHQTSVALGELQGLNTQTASQLMQWFPVAKIGLAGMAKESCKGDADGPARLDAEMLAALDNLAQNQRWGGQLVLAAYADYERAAAPSPAEVIELSQAMAARYILLDTFVKDGLGLFHWQSVSQIASLGAMAQAIGAQLVVAGSLSEADWPALCESAPAIVGVRGGVCTGGRASELCPDRLAQWLAWTQQG